VQFFSLDKVRKSVNSFIPDAETSLWGEDDHQGWTWSSSVVVVAAAAADAGSRLDEFSADDVTSW